MVKLSVFRILSDGSKKELYCNLIDLDGIKIDYDKIYDVLRQLYPASDGVEFCIIK